MASTHEHAHEHADGYGSSWHDHGTAMDGDDEGHPAAGGKVEFEKGGVIGVPVPVCMGIVCILAERERMVDKHSTLQDFGSETVVLFLSISTHFSFCTEIL